MNKILTYIILILILAAVGAAVTRKSWVDQEYNGHQLLNISNITITERFYDRTLHIEDGRIGNATEINATYFFQAGYPVLDTRDNASSWAATVALDNATNNSMKVYVDARDVINNASMVTHDASTNASQTVYTDARDVYYNTSIKSYVDNHFPTQLEITARDLYNGSQTNDSITTHNASIKSYIDDNFPTQLEITARGHYNGSQVNDSITKHLDNGSIIRSTEITARDFYNGSQVNDSITKHLDNGSIIRSDNISSDQVDAIANANDPNGTNFFATVNDLTGGNLTITSVVVIRNDEGVAYSKGDAVRFTGYISGNNRQKSVFANWSDEDYHADCIVAETIASGSFGECIVSGTVVNMDTSAWTEGAPLYLAQRGNLTQTYPSTATCIQMMGHSIRDHATLGVLWIHETGRCNDVPSSINISGTINATKGMWSKGLAVLTTVDNTSLWNSVVALDSATNTSMLSYITGLIANYFTKTEIGALSYKNGSEVNESIAAHNESMKIYVDARDTVNNESMVTHDASTNASMKVYVDTRDALFNTSAFLEALGFNETSDLKTYFDILYQAAGTYVTSVTGTSPITSTEGTTPDIGWAPVDIGLGWENLTNYNAGCSANTFVTNITDDITCTAISDVYLSNAGDEGTRDYNFSKNISLVRESRLYFDLDKNSSIHYNGSALVLQVN